MWVIGLGHGAYSQPDAASHALGTDDLAAAAFFPIKPDDEQRLPAAPAPSPGVAYGSPARDAPDALAQGLRQKGMGPATRNVIRARASRTPRWQAPSPRDMMGSPGSARMPSHIVGLAL